MEQNLNENAALAETQRQEEQHQQELQGRSDSGSPEVILPRRSERLRALANARERRSDLLRRSERLRNRNLRRELTNLRHLFTARIQADFNDLMILNNELPPTFVAPHSEGIPTNVDYYTERRSYQSSDGDLHRVCVICQEDFVVGVEVRKLKCKHFFHTECADTWFHSSSPANCPVCRQNVTAGWSAES